MDASDRRGARAWGAAALLIAALASACGSQPATPGPTATGPPTTTPSPAATPSPTPTPVAYADTLRIGQQAPWDGSTGLYPRGWNTGELAGVPTLTFGRLVYSGLYRFDAHDGAIPDLTDGRCFVPGDDGKVLRCRLIETTFHDGTPLTADDVAYTYQLFGRETLGGSGSLTDVRVVDARTVDFVLSAVDPTFETEVMPLVPIVPRHAVEAAVADFLSRTKSLEAGDLARLADAVKDETSRDPPVCSEARLAQVDDILQKAGARIYREDFTRPGGVFDLCGYLGRAAEVLGGDPGYQNPLGFGWAGLSSLLGQSGLDQAAGVFRWTAAFDPLALPGTGPYHFVGETRDRVHFEAFPGYHGGAAATRYIDFVPAATDGSDLEAGTVDIYPYAFLGPAFQATATSHGVRTATPPTPGFFALYFNVRPGRLFADVNLRRALQLCIDLERDLDAATSGRATPISGPVLPGSWADDPDLSVPARDVAAARSLVEGAGWTAGTDGTYAKDGTRLAADILVRADLDAERTKLLDLIAAQARDCGMELQGRGMSYDEYLAVLLQYPHTVPGTGEPFDVAVSGWNLGPDPAEGLGLFVSSAASDAAHPDKPNFGGFSDPAFDRLVEAGAATYDQAERATFYRQAQQELASQLPAIFLWPMNTYDAVRSEVTTVDGPLDLSVPNWAWQPERMVVVESAP